MIFQHFNLLSSRTACRATSPCRWRSRAYDGRRSRRASTSCSISSASTDKRDRYPAELSGGQKQRVGIARALATHAEGAAVRRGDLGARPGDHALDPRPARAASTRELGLTILLITHEMAVIRRRSPTEVAVIEGGRDRRAGRRSTSSPRPKHADDALASSPTRPAAPLPPSVAEQAAGRAASPAARRSCASPSPARTRPTPVLSRLARVTRHRHQHPGRRRRRDRRPALRHAGRRRRRANRRRRPRARLHLTQRGLDTEVLGHVA